MKFRFSLLLLLALSPCSFAQDNIPESVRLMIEQSQAGNQFDQMARMQMDMQYSDFLHGLKGDEKRKARVEAALLEILSTRVEMSSAAAYGRVSAEELKAVTDYDYLRERMSPLLNSAELAVLDNQRGGPSDEQLKRDYADELTRTAPDLTATNRELVLNTLIKYLRDGKGDAADLAKLSVEDLVSQQMQSIMQAGAELQSKISADQMQQVGAFLNQLQSNLYRNRSMSDL